MKPTAKRAKRKVASFMGVPMLIRRDMEPGVIAFVTPTQIAVWTPTSGLTVTTIPHRLRPITEQPTRRARK